MKSMNALTSEKCITNKSSATNKKKLIINEHQEGNDKT